MRALVWLPKLGEVRLAKKLEPGQTQTTEGLSVLVKPVGTIGNHRISLDSLPQHPDESVQRMFADLSSLLKTKRVYPELSLHRAPVVVGRPTTTGAR